MATASLTLSKETQDTFNRIREYAGKEALYAKVVAFFQDAGQGIGTNIQKRLKSGEAGLRRRTGALASSIVGMGTRSGGLPAIQVGALKGPSLRYIGVQEFGTKGEDPSSPYPTIVPKRAKNLAFPVNESLTPAGVPRYPGPRQDPRKLFYIPVRKGNTTGLLFDAVEYRKILKAAFKKKNFQSLKAYKAAWVLLKKVDVKPKRFLRGGFYGALPGVMERLGIYLRDLLKQILGGPPAKFPPMTGGA